MVILTKNSVTFVHLFEITAKKDWNKCQKYDVKVQKFETAYFRLKLKYPERIKSGVL